MRSALSSLFCLAASLGCASAQKQVPKMDNCIPSFIDGVEFSCVDAAGKGYSLLWVNAGDLVCFKSGQFKTFVETLKK